jgi:hypothetical protein
MVKNGGPRHGYNTGEHCGAVSKVRGQQITAVSVPSESFNRSQCGSVFEVDQGPTLTLSRISSLHAL